MGGDVAKPALVLVTGAAGFIGSRFVQSCAQKGLAVVSVDKASHFESRPEHKGVAFGRIVDRGDLFAWLDREKPSLSGIVHLGACTDTTELNEAYLTETNVEYSRKLWRYATRERVPFVYASSAATYGDGAHGYDDDEALIPRLKPLNPYGRSKQEFDLWALAEERAGASPPSWSGFKFFNVYGFGERHKGKMASVVLHAFDQIAERGAVRLFKSHRDDIPHGQQKRDFIHVADVLEVLHFALAKPIRRGILNIGTGCARSFLDLVRRVFAELGRPERIDYIDTPMEIRSRYQYFTEAPIARLRHEGYAAPFDSLETGVHLYIQDLLRGRSGGRDLSRGDRSQGSVTA